ncbi:MAG: imelysin family protein [Candidatus Binatia bacterium]
MLLSLAADRAVAQCAGDCDGNLNVSITELIRGVNLALGSATGEPCAALDINGNGQIAINELIAAVASALEGCDGPVTAAAVVARYADNLHANYDDAIDGARALQTAIDAFVAAPSQAGLEAARQAWRDARPAYLQTEMARFYDGPIDNEADGPEGLINAWPLDEGYIDYVEGNANAGIVNQPELHPTIDADLLVELNEGEGETTISTGYHAIEFLLWGQDLSADGPGDRPFTDYVTDGSGTAANQARRGDYLRAAVGLLVANLEQVRDAWLPGVEDNYRAELLAEETDEALRRILTGMGTLSGGELTGERLSVAFDTKDQEDEHSCFSDNTHIDHRMDETGIQNAFLGRYGSADGPGIYDLVLAVDPTLADATRDAIEAARLAVFAMPVPFDQAVLGDDSAPGRVAIAAAITALEAQTVKIAESAEALGVPISTTLP